MHLKVTIGTFNVIAAVKKEKQELGHCDIAVIALIYDVSRQPKSIKDFILI